MRTEHSTGTFSTSFDPSDDHAHGSKVACDWLTIIVRFRDVICNRPLAWQGCVRLVARYLGTTYKCKKAHKTFDY